MKNQMYVCVCVCNLIMTIYRISKIKSILHLLMKSWMYSFQDKGLGVHSYFPYRNKFSQQERARKWNKMSADVCGLHSVHKWLCAQKTQGTYKSSWSLLKSSASSPFRRLILQKSIKFLCSCTEHTIGSLNNIKI